MRIHAIQTGTVTLTTTWREGIGHGRARLLAERRVVEPAHVAVAA